MTIWRMVAREIQNRKLNFGLGLLSVAVAVGCMVGGTAALRAHELRASRILQEKEAAVKERMSALNDEMRRIMLKLGPTIIIVPKDQNLGDWHADDYAAKHIPEKYMERLSMGGGDAIGRFAPRLREKVKWPETKWTVIVVGTGDAVGMPAQDAGEAFARTRTPRTKVALGYEAHSALGLKKGDKVRIMGKEFEVHECDRERGTKDDVTLWLDLRDAQELLGRKGFINEIHVVEYRGGWDGSDQARAEIEKLLPGTRVIEETPVAAAKALANMKVAEEAAAQTQGQREARSRLNRSRERLLWALNALVTAVCGAWLALMAFGNARERRTEIGALSAMGYDAGRIVSLFALRFVLMGLLGGAVGFLCGSVAAGCNFSLLGPALVVALAMTGMAGIIPAAVAARQDPAEALMEG